MPEGREEREEWLLLMTELAALDRDEYRQIRAECWDRVVKNHERKSEQEIADWKRNAS